MRKIKNNKNIFPKICTVQKNVVNLHTSNESNDIGEMAEWSIAAVLKTVEGHTSGGSNPSLSAKVFQFWKAFLLYVQAVWWLLGGCRNLMGESINIGSVEI